ncbi:MAG: outer membrane protein assembly factor BamD [Gammaproteobacteria bacterium]|nr:outer membrane protein assembly factor BamD [Gammaproteobacteria bacterium]
MKLKILAIHFMLIFLLSNCSFLGTAFEEKDSTIGMTAGQLYEEGRAFLYAQDFVNAIRVFEILEARYPFGKYSTQAMLDLAYAHYASNHKDECISEANRFIRLYPNHPEVSYAYYLKALANFDKDSNVLTRFFAHDPSRYDTTNLKNSFNDFTVVVNKFPDSKYAEDSLNRLRYIKNQIAKNELYIAKYYNKRSAHVASVNRVKYLLENYGGTPSTKHGLLLMVDSYNKMEMFDLAYDAARVLEKNYPDYKIVKNSNKSISILEPIKKNVQEENNKNENEESWWDFLNIFS